MRRLMRRVAADFAHYLGFYTADDMTGLQDRLVGVVDAKRTDNEMLRLTVNEYEAQVGDIREVRQLAASLPADAPPTMIRHVVKKQDHLLETLIVGVERRVAARERARLKPRGPNGRFILEDRG